MTPFSTLATARTPEGGELSLHKREPHFYLRLDRQPLMATNAPESERVLAQQACQRILDRPAPRVLIGGLGFGFTLAQVLELVGKKAHVHVAELVPEVVAWNREFLGDVNGRLLDDPRVTISIADVYAIMGEAGSTPYDAILLDVDNGPVAMVQKSNARLYQSRGFATIQKALKSTGRVVFWSANRDEAFAERLTKAGFKVEVVAAKAYAQAKRNSHTIFVADRGV